jgi:SAM-dependent methyltransferase
MSQADSKFAGSIPALYDRYLGPFIFQPYAAEAAQRLSGLKDGKLLEMAAGTGILTWELAHMLPQNVSIVATDLNQPMLDFASAKRRHPRAITWRQANALDLPFEDQAFDVVVCQFGVMFFPDKSAAYREVLRVLKPGGLFLFSTWDRLEDNEIPMAVAEGVNRLFPDDPPQFVARTPHGYHDRDLIQREVTAARFDKVKIETVQLRSRAPSHRDPAIGFCQGSPLRNEIEAREPGRLEEATEAAATAVKAKFGAGPIDGRIQAHVISANK